MTLQQLIEWCMKEDFEVKFTPSFDNKTKITVTRHRMPLPSTYCSFDITDTFLNVDKGIVEAVIEEEIKGAAYKILHSPTFKSKG